VSEIQVKLPDGEVRHVPAGTTPAELLEGTGAVVAAVDGELRDLHRGLTADAAVAPVPAASDRGREVIRHSTAHVMAQAVTDLFPGAKFAIGPPVDDGFYYDFDVPEPFTPEDLERIEARMREIIASRQRFVRDEISRPESLEVFADQPYKLEILSAEAGETVDEMHDGGASQVSVYRNVEPDGTEAWVDLCRGPHVPNTGRLGAFKLMRVAGAYWRGDERRRQLQRIYGTAWENRGALEDHLHRLAEAERRDHRKLGKELELFHLDPTAPGMPYWLPRGLKLMNTLLAFWREDHETRGYQEISAPLINERSLWETSGHWDHYKDDMFLVPVDDHTLYGVKPMNCPNAMVVYNTKVRSYRDLPLRLSDCDTLHRNERSGTLHGLLRVRRFQQDDAHIFLPADQIAEEYERVFDICDYYYSLFDLDYELRLGTRPDKFVGDVETWDQAEATLRSILDARAGAGNYRVAEGDGAFYGPKIDIIMRDSLGREWQMGTIQLDFQLPRRFGCEYTDRDGQRKTPVVVHRVIYGTLERFIGILIEHTGGAFPLWLSPVQVKVIPVRADHDPYAERVAEGLRARKFRVEVDHADEPLGAKIRRAQLEKSPVMLVVGNREADGGTVTARLRSGSNLPAMPPEELAALLDANVHAKAFTMDDLEAHAVAQGRK
jgi:threonyl-tRNA synthetase